jgi:ornithine carbamoyltransferase
MRHLISLRDGPADLMRRVLDLSVTVKKDPVSYERAMRRRTLFMVFEKPSLRTRVSFEVGMVQMGGHAIYYDLTTSPLGAGKEDIHDTIKTVSRYGDLIMARLFEHAKLEEIARYAEVPVINGLTDHEHPCQILSDLFTVNEHKGTLRGLKLAYFGDGHNNVTHSLMYGGAQMGLRIAVACPPGESYAPDPEVVAGASALARQTGAELVVTHDPAEAAAEADVVYTDSWMSYHIPKQMQAARVKALTPYQVNAALLKMARPDAIFMNCLPALRGYEQTAEVIDGPQSVVFDQAENRLHVQKALMILLIESAEGGT